MSELPTFNQVVSAIPACPECGANAYMFRAKASDAQTGEERALSVVCRTCKTDILAVYKARTAVMSQTLISVALGGLAFLLAIAIGIVKLIPVHGAGP